MNKVAIIIAAGVGMIATAAPASAQDYRHRDGRDYNSRYARDYRSVGGYEFNQRRDEIQARLQQGIRSGQLSRSEVAQINARIRSLNAIEAAYRRSGRGLTMGERQDLDRRFDALERSIRFERNDRDYRGRRW